MKTREELESGLSFLGWLRKQNLLRCPDFGAGDINDWSPAERGNELAGETGEACNELKKLLRHDKRVTGLSREFSSERVAILERARNELADVVICVDLICAQLGINIEAAVRAKFNATSDKIGSGVKL